MAILDDLIVHTGHTDSEGSDQEYIRDDRTPSRRSSTSDLEPKNNKQLKDKDTSAARLVRDLEFFINSTISQDQTCGQEQTTAEQLATLAQRLSKIQGISFKKDKKDSEEAPSDPPSEVPRSRYSKSRFGQMDSRYPDRIQRDAGHQRRTSRYSSSSSPIQRNLPGVRTHTSIVSPLGYSLGSDERSDNESSEDGGLLQNPNVKTRRNLEARSQTGILSTVVKAAPQPPAQYYRVEAGPISPPVSSTQVLRRQRGILQSPEHPGARTQVAEVEDIEANEVTSNLGKLYGGTGKVIPSYMRRSADKPGRAVGKYQEFQQQATSATDEDLRDMQRMFQTLTAEEQHNMSLSALDPVAYYFAHLKDRARPSREDRIAELVHQPMHISEKKVVAKPLEESTSSGKGSPISERLLMLLESLSPEEQSKLIERSLRKKVRRDKTDQASWKALEEEIRKAQQSTSSPAQSIANSNEESSQESNFPQMVSPKIEGNDHNPTSFHVSSDLGKGMNIQNLVLNQSSSRHKTRSFLPKPVKSQPKQLLSVSESETRCSPNQGLENPCESTVESKLERRRSHQGSPSPKPTKHSQEKSSSQINRISPKIDEQSIRSEATTIVVEGNTLPPSTDPHSTPDLVLIRLLQQRISKLEAEKTKKIEMRVEGVEASKTQVVYSVSCHKSKSTVSFLDKPLAYFDSSDEFPHLQGQKPFPKDIDLFIERQRGAISFIIYKDLECCNVEAGLSVHKPNSKYEGPPQIKESILVASRRLQDAFAFLKTAFPDETKHFPTFVDGDYINSPYLFYYHQRSFIRGLRSLPEEHQSQIQLFRDYVESSFGDEFERVHALISGGNITAQYLPYLFEPETVVVWRRDGCYSGYEQEGWPYYQRPRRTPSSAGNQRDLLPLGLLNTIDGNSWNFDGIFWKNLTLLPIEFGDPEPHVKPITDLDIIPLVFSGPDVEMELKRRGLIFWACRSRKYVSYKEDSNTVGDNLKQKSESRFMVDLRTYQKMHQQVLEDRDTSDKYGLSQEEMDAEDPPPGNFILLLPRTVLGFNMHRKQWLQLNIARISDVEWNKEAFRSLVVDNPVKELITALVTNQLAHERATDLMDGKGTGLIILLHGGPGTGKTLTAESVAEFAEKPLYRVTCGDIGTNPEQVEEYLKTILLLGKTWQCVVLLDEADVFLEQRSLRDLQRNALVSVFLRVLEYYDGILILTSNRVGTFDEAFKSRIQLALHYDNLQEWQRRSIWETFIKRLESFTYSAPPSRVSTFKRQVTAENLNLPSSKASATDLGVDTLNLRCHLDDLAKQEMNGRQIRNAITTARQLALYKGVKMNFEHLQHVIQVAGKFDRYLFELHEEIDDNQIARDDGVR